MLSIGKSDAIVQVLPAALRFWEKLGVRPRGGGKDTGALVIYEGTSDAKEELVADWLQSLSQTYRVSRALVYRPLGNNTFTVQKFRTTYC